MDEKIGEERLGAGKSILSSFGSTLIIGSIAFILFILIIGVTIYFCKRSGQSAKCKSGIDKLKRKLFWNPFIRYILLNCLKFNMAAFVIFKSISESKGEDITIAILICLCIFAAALVFIRILKRKRSKLFEQATVLSIGSLYSDKNVTSSRH